MKRISKSAKIVSIGRDRVGEGSPRRIVMAGYPDAEILDIAGPIEVFSVADRFLRDKTGNTTPIYTTEIVALQAGTFTTSSGIRLIADRTIHDVRGTVDTLIVAGGVGTRQAMFDAKLISWLKDMAPRVRRLCSVCSGAFILAEAGLLDGRAATTHWRWCDTLSARYPAISVKSDPIFVQDGNVYTSAGVTAGIDLALAMVEDDHGRNLALAVARGLVLFLKRPGGQSQFSVQLTSQMAGREPIRELQVWVADHPDANLSVETLAERVAMSPRNFARVFRRETGMTPGTFVEISRVESARRRLEESAAGVDAIASECGFGTRESMRRAFLRVLGVPPSSYRERFRSAAPPALRRSAGT